MDLFACFFAVSSMFSDNWSDNFDIISALPLEVAIIILRHLDPKSLLTAIRVSRRWLNVVKADRVLRNTVREEIARQKAEKFKKEMFLSRCVSDHLAMLSKGRKSAQPYPEVRKTRKFEKSIKTVDASQSKRKMRTWVSSVSTASAKNFR